MKLEQNRLDYHHHLGYALATTRIRCIAAVMIGLLLTTSNAMAKGLWVANADSNTIAEYEGKLKKPHRVLNDTTDLDGPSTVAFHGGNLWVTNFNSNSIFMYTSKQIKKLKKHVPTPTVIISQDTGANLAGPEGLVFDSSGNMWVGAENGGVILQYTPSQLAASGNPTPNIILNIPGGFSSPSHLRFDSAGNLWVSDEDIANGNSGFGEVFKFTHTQITALVAGNNVITPVFGIALNAFAHLETIAFDGGGNLWVADENGNQIYKFSASDLGGTGLSQNLTPAVVLSTTSVSGGSCNESLGGPYGLAFNVGGDLFVSNANTPPNAPSGCLGSLAQFSARSIRTTGSPTPKAFITNGVNSPNALTFGPTIP
jgi:sugar lactone lactonase YvrE